MSAPIVHGGGITEAAAHFGGGLEDWLDLSTGINPCPVALPDVPERAWHRLPDRQTVDNARLAAREYYRTDGVLPLPVPGTQSVIQLLPRLMNEYGKTPAHGRVAIFGPTYGEYARVLSAAGFAVDRVEDADALSAEHALVIVVNPNNPTGRAFAPAELLAMAARQKASGGLLLVDEAFGDLQPELSVAGHVPGQGNLIVFRSFGKFFGLAGLRLGFVVATEPVLASFADWLGPWAVSGPALTISKALMQGDTTAIAAGILERRAGLDAALVGAGLKRIGGTGLFVLVEHPRAALLQERLCEAHILTRKFDYAPTWLRIGLAPDAAGDRRLADALALMEP
ncbi:threonine-phosphate decarboxylase CobD [Ensifer adhaerens]|uniref:threonine-phosphate decarboxylase CobD n=1 Tax=Ensifer adhaerens TaxID=106592 RepID=UPI001CC0CCB9|nr:threonine-phosphate decarboxylase CobD [Ensifer adhaerens]MBZ7922027.1 threonine-phosphate decarboxylase CobD [Ensifer adhaerens]UAX94417.1 threonine-phosphate decarboxylase CobD [Ensifer adhaerens]UAY02052.1 threonine-phosphate decarboxylase CobD [Ensifer adhaerens]UAY09435.1 threonine-phosphate decarboxylase CobD [Ensifer adhaerens]